MTRQAFFRALLVLALAVPAAACSHAGDDAAASRAEPSSSITAQVHKTMDEARQKLATQDLELGKLQVGGAHVSAPPTGARARITPAGELVIDNQSIEATPEQQRMLLAYRGEVLALASAGMDVGEEAAALGTTATRLALGAVFSGKGNAEIEAELKPEIERIKTAALQLCDRLPSLVSSQQALAASLPAFQPWATLQESDIADCRKDVLADD